MEYKEDGHYIKKVLDGETNAYAFLVNKYKSMAFSLALRMLKNREDAEEVAQDAFVKAYQSLSQFRGGARFSTWLYRIVYTTAISKMRRSSKEVYSIEDAGVEEKESGEISDAYYQLKESERKKFLDIVLEKLDADENFLVTLYYYEEKELDEIARITGLTKGNVKVRIFRARQKMMVMLKKYLKEELIELL
jgi:RNA polymerase sigma factor (sigma-70 family)